MHISLQSDVFFDSVNLVLRLFDLPEFIVWNWQRFTTSGCKDFEIRKLDFLKKMVKLK